MKDDNKITVSISVNKEVWEWITKRAEEWHCSRSWLVENMLFHAMIKSGALPDAYQEGSQ